MGLYYKSTRNSNLKVTASEAILKGLAPDGGLFVPSELPKLDVTMSDLKGKTYQEIAYLVMKQFLTDFTEEELKNCIDKAYDSKFDTEEIAPLVKVDDTYYMELFHGATIAFKDMALSILPHLKIQEKPHLQALRMWKERGSSYSIQRMVSARYRNSRW